MKKRIAIIGLDPPEYEVIRKNYFGPLVYHPLLPKIKVQEGKLLVERNSGYGMLSVDKVVFHGIFEDDFDFIGGLALWGGPCYPNAFSMMNCRMKLPCLVRALQFSRFNDQRGYLAKGLTMRTDKELVAKWGNWHCGENKHRFQDQWQSTESAIIEPFFEGEAVRVIIIGKKHWQIKLEGTTWLKSIHADNAAFMEIDQELLEDTRNIQKGMGMDIIANDYIVGNDGRKHLLEVNHIPNVTRFEELREAYLEVVVDWMNKE